MFCFFFLFMGTILPTFYSCGIVSFPHIVSISLCKLSAPYLISSIFTLSCPGALPFLPFFIAWIISSFIGSYTHWNLACILRYLHDLLLFFTYLFYFIWIFCHFFLFTCRSIFSILSFNHSSFTFFTKRLLTRLLSIYRFLLPYVQLWILFDISLFFPVGLFRFLCFSLTTFRFTMAVVCLHLVLFAF